MIKLALPFLVVTLFFLLAFLPFLENRIRTSQPVTKIQGFLKTAPAIVARILLELLPHFPGLFFFFLSVGNFLLLCSSFFMVFDFDIHNHDLVEVPLVAW